MCLTYIRLNLISPATSDHSRRVQTSALRNYTPPQQFVPSSSRDMSLSTTALPGTALAITNLVDYQSRIYYQDTSNYIQEIQYNEPVWTINDSPIVQAAFNTPLAAISWNSGEMVRSGMFTGEAYANINSTQINVFYLDEDYTIQQMVYSSSVPSWKLDPGMAELNLKVGSDSHISAVQFPVSGGMQLRLFYQGSSCHFAFFRRSS